LAACVYAGVPLIRKESTNNNNVPAVAQVTPPTSTAEGGAMVLCYGETTRIATTTAALRLVASLAPGANLLGASAIEHAVTDAWLSFLGSSVELPLQAMMVMAQQQQQQPHAQISKDWKDALTKLNQHLTFQTYMVGQAGVTLADIRLLVSLYTAVNAGVWDATAAAAESQDTNNLVRWYQTLTHQEWFTTSVKSLATISAAPVGGASASASAAAASTGAGIQLNGVAPAVVGNLYRRHRIRIKEVVKNEGNDYLDQSITVAGWARTTRNANKGQLLFVELSDGSSGSSLQCVLDSETSEGFDECKASGGTGASFQFIGTLIPSQGDGQAVELQVTTGKLLGAVYGGNAEGTEVGGKLYPMAKKEHTLEHMREHAHLRARGRVHSAAMRVRHAMAYATHNFFHNHGFLYVHTPIITGADCEGAGEQFGITTMLGSDHTKPGVKVPVYEPPVVAAETEEISKSELKRRKKAADKAASKGPTDPNKLVEEKVVGAVDYTSDFFGQRVNLTVSGQLNVETHACALSDVYTFGPTFRAEMSYTSRHLSEFWMIEPEIAFADLADDINLAEDYLKYCVKFALENCAEDLEFFENNPHGEEGLRDRLRNVLENPFKVRDVSFVSCLFV
jgi:asparaginyl-tRNA synthetase